MATSLSEITPTGKLRLNFHPGQERAWDSDRRFVLTLAGTQGGKTEFGPHWLYREIQRRGPGDYLVVTPTYPLLTLKALPAFLRLFRRTLDLGEFVGSPSRKFTFSRAGALRTFGHVPAEETCVFFGHASDPESLESATAKAAWLDEAGQKKFRLGSWEAIQRRLSIHQGRALITTTPYDLGWLKQQVHDRWKKGDPTYDVVRFDSTENPAFPRQEFERARASLPGWKFDLFYRALFTRPAGMIYDVFDDEVHKVPRFALDPAWPRFLGLDFGGVNTAGVFVAQRMLPPASYGAAPQPTNQFYAYREYKAGSRTARDHADELLKADAITRCVGGAGSEDQWRSEFAAAGLPVAEPPVSDVEVGIDRVYGAFKRGELFVFDDLDGLLDEIGSYARELDPNGEPTEKIEDKASYHRLDALRYIGSYLWRHHATTKVDPVPNPERHRWTENAAHRRGMFGVGR